MAAPMRPAPHAASHKGSDTFNCCIDENHPTTTEEVDNIGLCPRVNQCNPYAASPKIGNRT